jgi:hypothetical protein
VQGIQGCQTKEEKASTRLYNGKDRRIKFIFFFVLPLKEFFLKERRKSLHPVLFWVSHHMIFA